jgi:hypothetical protein
MHATGDVHLSGARLTFDKIAAPETVSARDRETQPSDVVVVEGSASYPRIRLFPARVGET